MGARVNNRTAETRYDLLNLAQCCFLDGPGGGAFAFLFGTTPGHLTDLLVPTPGNLPFFYYKNANARRGGRAGGGGGGMGTATLRAVVPGEREDEVVLSFAGNHC